MNEGLRREKREFSDYLGGKVNIYRKNMFRKNLYLECAFIFGINARSQEKLLLRFMDPLHKQSPPPPAAY